MLHSYQAEHGPDFPWSVGKEGLPRPAAWRGVERGRADPMVDLRPFLLRRGGHEYGWTEAAGAVPGERRGGVKGGPRMEGPCRPRAQGPTVAEGSERGALHPRSAFPPQARKHLHNFEATHCTPLPAQHFQMPWHL